MQAPSRTLPGPSFHTYLCKAILPLLTHSLTHPPTHTPPPPPPPPTPTPPPDLSCVAGTLTGPPQPTLHCIVRLGQRLQLGQGLRIKRLGHTLLHQHNKLTPWQLVADAVGTCGAQRSRQWCVLHETREVQGQASCVFWGGGGGTWTWGLGGKGAERMQLRDVPSECLLVAAQQQPRAHQLRARTHWQAEASQTSGTAGAAPSSQSHCLPLPKRPNPPASVALLQSLYCIAVVPGQVKSSSAASPFSA